jgi:hypothetical protein
MMVGKDISDISVKVPEDAYDTGKHIPTFSAYLTAIVRDSTGRVVRVHRQRSHSPTANFMGLLLPLNWYISTGQTFTLTNTSNSTCSYHPNFGKATYCLTYPNNGFNWQSYLVMIQVGSGTQSNPYNAYSLASPIANGSGTGQLVYGTPSVSNTAIVSGSSAYIVIEQTFSNQTSSTIDITEVGIIVNVQTTCTNCQGSTNCGQLLVWYDALSSAISVPAGGYLTIAYTFTVNP